MAKSKIKKTNPELKEALKNEVAPFLIGLREEMKGVVAEIRGIKDSNRPMSGVDIFNLLKGKDAETPIRGKDYWTDADRADVIKAATPVCGKDYFTDEQTKAWLEKVTPKKGVDYVDGKDAHTPVFGVDFFTSEEQKLFADAILERATPIKGIHYKDGKDGKSIVNGNKMSGQEIAEAIINDNAKIPAKNISGLDNRIVEILALNGIGSNQGSTALGAGSGGSSGATAWGAITGTLSAQSDLQSALDAKQATLVSGTNIKTINGTSLLGSGNISVSASPAGSTGYLQFNNASAFAADSNLFWDNTNKRFGLHTTSPSTIAHFKGTLVNNTHTYTVGDASLDGRSETGSGGYMAGDSVNWYVYAYKTAQDGTRFYQGGTSYQNDNVGNNNTAIDLSITPAGDGEGVRVVRFMSLSVGDASGDSISENSLSIGYNSGDTIEYRIYAYRDFNGRRVYSANYEGMLGLTISNITAGVDITISGSVGNASGYRILRSVNGGGFNDGKDVGSSFTDDANGWDAGATDVSPSSPYNYHSYQDVSGSFSDDGNNGWNDGDGSISPTSPYIISENIPVPLLTLENGTLVLSKRTPRFSDDTGTDGEVVIDDDYIYWRSNSKWKRALGSLFP